ncbi:MAG: acyl-CoA/acyl-ACP dehydrogenase [Sphingomonadaceae bacterium]|nr:acyl-CoA/acyl-ACP dehydrogenase [Sphingomonadaceae bacterium]
MIVDLIPDEDQSAIEDGIVSFLADVLPVERLRNDSAHAGAAEAAVWSQLCELGLFGLGLTEEQGGLGLGLGEEALVARAFGRHLISPCVLAQLCAPHLALDEATRDALVSGEQRAAFAIADGYVVDGAGAQWIVVMGPDGASLESRSSLTLSETNGGLDHTLLFEKLEGGGGKRDSALRIEILIAAYLVGVSQAATDMAVEYAKIREQFGQAIGAFQAIKHICADMATRAAAADAQMLYAATVFGHGEDDAGEAAAARLLARDAGLQNSKANIQTHGGMGFTDECDAHLFLKRAMVMDMLGTNAKTRRDALTAG